MAVAVAKLDDLLEALETLSNDFETFLSKDTGKVVAVSEEYWRYAKEKDGSNGHPDWMLEIIAEARDILARPDRYLPLPSSWDIHEYEIVERFCRTREVPETRNRLLSAIRGKGAFRRFKDQADELGVLEDWYDYKVGVLTNRAIAWCEENDVELVQSDA